MWRDRSGTHYGIDVEGDAARVFRWDAGDRAWVLDAIGTFSPPLGVYLFGDGVEAAGEIGMRLARLTLRDPALSARAKSARGTIVRSVKHPVARRRGAVRDPIVDAAGRAACAKDDRVAEAIRAGAEIAWDDACAPGGDPWRGPCRETLRRMKRRGRAVACASAKRPVGQCSCRWDADTVEAIRSGAVPLSGTPDAHAPGEHFACGLHPWNVERARATAELAVPGDPGGSPASLSYLPREEQWRIVAGRNQRAAALSRHPYAAHWREADEHRRAEAARRSHDSYDGVSVGEGLLRAWRDVWRSISTGFDWNAASFVLANDPQAQSIISGSDVDEQGVFDRLCLLTREHPTPANIRWIKKNLSRHCKWTLEEIGKRSARARRDSARRRKYRPKHR